MTYDVIIIGSGIAGSATAFYLSRYDLKVLVLDKEVSPVMGTSKANSAIMHAGYDPIPNTNKAYHNVRGIKLAEDLCPKLNIPYRQNGSLILEIEPSDLIDKLYKRGLANGVEKLEIVDQKFLQTNIPLINPNIKRALLARTGGIIDPFLFTYSLIANAKYNGVITKYSEEVIDITKNDDLYVVSTKKHKYNTKIIVNAAGLYSDKINNFINDTKYEIAPLKGEYYLLDKCEKKITDYTLFPLPTQLGKGILVFNTIDNNILIGPNAIPAKDKDDLGVSEGTLKEMFNKAKNIIPSLGLKNVIASFAGLRANLTTTDDFVVGRTTSKGFYNLVGINSPGLSSALSLGIEIKDLIITDYNYQLKNDYKLLPLPRKTTTMNPEKLNKLIQLNPDYGKIICKCEMVSLGEIKEFIKAPYNAKTLDDLKRLARAGAGRCQSGFCQNDLVLILANELGVSPTKVTKFGNNSLILKGKR